MLLKYTKQTNFQGLKEKSGPSLIIIRYLENFLKTTEKVKADLKERFRMSEINKLSVKLIKKGSLSVIIERKLNISSILMQEGQE